MKKRDEWHIWYAWFPVKIQGKYYWRKRIERCWYQIDSRFAGRYVYREIGSDIEYCFAGVAITKGPTHTKSVDYIVN